MLIARGLIVSAVAVLMAVPAFSRGTPEETWQPVTGREIWRHEFDLEEVPAGTHNVIIRARDFAGNETIAGPHNIRVDPSVGLPTARIVYPERGAILRDDLNAIGVAGGRAGIDRVELWLDEGAPLAADGTEYWGRTISTRNLADGSYTLHARAVDLRGTVGPVTSVPFVLNRDAPTVVVTSHRTGELVSGSITMQGIADDANGIEAVELSVDGGETFEPLRLRSARGETAVEFSFAVQTRRLPDGATVYRLRAVDTTGAATVHPVLFFVDNEPPELEVLAPAQDESVFGTVRFTGMVSDAVGVARLFYELDRGEHDIELRPGDPYWTADVDLSVQRGRTATVRFTAVDRSGNRTTVQHRLQYDTEAALPTVTLRYPEPAGLSALGPEAAIYGSISGGGVGLDGSIVVEGAARGEYPARPGFRIPAVDLDPGRGELRIRARSSDGRLGEPLRLRVTRLPEPEDATPPAVSRIAVTSVEPYAYLNRALTLAGTVRGATAATRLEYRLAPEEPWRSLTLTREGGGSQADFSVEVRLTAAQEGPVHMELRTVGPRGGDLPLYLPLNYAPQPPGIAVTSPRPSDVINGLVTVSGAVCTRVPITELAYTLDGQNYTPLEVTPTCVGNAFVFTVDFTALQESGGRLQLRVVDAAGNTQVETPQVRIDRAGDLPRVELHLPQDGDVITEDLAISGMAFDDDGVAAIHWRVGDGEFQRVSADQSFRIDLALDELESGLQTIEVYAEDIYGLAGEPARAAIHVSTDRPQIEVLEPAIDVVNRGTVELRGSASDLNGIESVRISLDNGNTFQTAEGTGEWSLSLNTSAYRDGSYSVLVAAVDTLGVESRTSALISIDNTAPTVLLAEPAEGAAVGSSLRLSGRVSDNIGVDAVFVELSAAADREQVLRKDLDPQVVLLESIDLESLDPGFYNLQLVAVDYAGNRSVVTRSIERVAHDGAYTVALLNPLPGTVVTGPVVISGRVSGPALPARVRLFDGDLLIANADVDRNGYFHHQLDTPVQRSTDLSIAARVETASGDTVSSPRHTVTRRPYGPAIVVESHLSGDMVSGRPWLRGRAWIEPTPDEEAALEGRRDRRSLEVSEVQVSVNNGRTFQSARGGSEWQFRLESADLPRGPLPIVVRAEFADGRSAVTRLVLTVDSAAPVLTLTSPQEDSRHAETLIVYGTARDEHGIESIEVALRPGDKSGYSVPQFIQGLYLDSHFFGATYADLGLGVSFFDDNVKLQVQAGVAPPGRFSGTVVGSKLLANVLVLPFDYFFGPDWGFFSMAFALGANFSYFTMGDDNDGLVMSAVLAQWEFARFHFEQWRAFRTSSLYLEPNLWFASSDVEAGAVFRMSLGLRLGLL
ncbi:MAG: hypothetical protein EA384_07785 [Spirochaetaceae bacterium]|nr:MAG: hypothetical protein EA384_07785 [Spirochaetaceae bacterium]